MDGLLYLLLGVLVGVALTLGWRRRPPSSKAGTAPAATTPAPAAAAPTPAPVAAAPPTDERLTSRLQRLAVPLEAAYEETAHPADLRERTAFKDVVALLGAADVPMTTVLQYAIGSSHALGCAALAAIATRADAGSARGRLFDAMAACNAWRMYFALRAWRIASPADPLGVPLTAVPGWWEENPFMLSVLREYLDEAAAGSEIGLGGALERLDTARRDRLDRVLRAIDNPSAREMLGQLHRWRQQTLNRPLLGTFGRFLEESRETDALCEFDFLTEPLAVAESTLRASPPRSVVIVGEARSGKTSVVRLVAARMAKEGFAFFESGAAEIMAGQKYIGEVEERLRQIIQELAYRKRVIWYVPDLLQLATAGRHNAQPASLLEQVQPALASGELVVITEATPARLARTLQVNAGLRGLLQMARLRPLAPADVDRAVETFVEASRTRLKLITAPRLAADALLLARQYLGTQDVVGGVLDFLKLACTRAVANGRTNVDRSALLDTLAQVSGLPRAILDEGQAISLSEVRGFFDERVMGQEAAVSAVVDRIAMLKAGLTDPNRPIAVFLFAGPTGTGKTELAKTLAEYLFGAPDRLVRIDMSELQSPDALRRLVGESREGEGDSLTSRVRKQPFCVVLLDEFEKAHSNAWDLFLQVFDDGRLTDAGGNTVDFRHTMIVLTTNLGATSHKGAELGFTPGSSAFSDDQILRAVRQHFRPEFINRLDRVLVFQPLARGLMRGILRKELARVVERRGLKSKSWAVEWESSAVEFLLDKGFSPDMGARPLRRAIDQYLLAPLAATLVEHRFPEGEQFLFVRSDGQAIQVEFVDPDAEPEPLAARAAPMDVPPDYNARGPGRAAPPSLSSIVLQPTGSAAERSVLRERLEIARATLASTEFDALTTSIGEALRGPDFWEQPGRFAVLTRYALVDRLRAALETAHSLAQRLERSLRGATHSRSLAARLALQLYLIELGAADARTGTVADVALCVQPALDGSGERRGAESWCKELLAMYRGWAVSRNMHVAEQSLGGDAALLVGGFGAWATLSREAGLHVLEDGDGGRVAARVRIAADEPVGPEAAHQRIARLTTLLAGAPVSSDIVRRYRRGPSPLVRDARGGWRSGRLDLVLAGQFDLLEPDGTA